MERKKTSDSTRWFTLSYENLPITVWTKVSSERLYPIDYAHPAEYDEGEELIDYEYVLTENEVFDWLWDHVDKIEELKDVDDDEEIEKYIRKNLEDLFEEFEEEIKEEYQDEAIESAEENYDSDDDYPEPDPYDYYDK